MKHLIKRWTRKILPLPIRKMVSKRLVAQRVSKLSKLSPRDAFDQIYRQQLWRQGDSLSGLGSEGKWADEYVAYIIEYIESSGALKVVDAGCGDFSVGSKFSNHCEQLICLDISSEIINRNRARFAELHNVEFRLFNLLDDDLPDCDLLLLRQVLQHNSNEQIERILQSIESSNIKNVLIAEHSMRADVRTHANIDLGSHSVITRVANGSGVDIGLPPFSRSRNVVAEFEPGPENGAELNSVLYLYEMKPN